MTDPFALERFVVAQDADDTYGQALAELRAGRKRSHWMWFVFPQFAGLGRSATAKHFAIKSVDEARAYLEHPLLGLRLTDCATAAAQATARSTEDLLGDVDAVKLRSSMTLFDTLTPRPSPFTAVLDRWFGGEPDAATLALLR